MRIVSACLVLSWILSAERNLHGHREAVWTTSILTPLPNPLCKGILTDRHVRHSKCRQEFLDRVKSNAAAKKEAKAAGKVIVLKRLPLQPREARKISSANNQAQTLTALPYETTI